MLVIFSILAGYCLEIKLFSYFLCFLTSYNISQPKKQGPFESKTKVVYCLLLEIVKKQEKGGGGFLRLKTTCNGQ